MGSGGSAGRRERERPGRAGSAAAMSPCGRGMKAEAEGRGFPAGPGVKVFLHWSGGREQERYQVYSQGSLSAEEICMDLAQRIGEGFRARHRAWTCF
ncbi:non-receptor tyrosine-protein kinase TYK2-like [Cinclus cinclus]|uniref:non-receptor tyrosine-protein kinase TYK2-like n=1 Tax=Cinclus cinclus TaxID=127875 RepID=UPI002E0D3976